MKRIGALAALTLSVALLSGCSILYPHWGETSPPASTPTPTASVTPSSTPSASNKPKQPVSVEVMQSNVDPNAVQLQVVAQATGITEDTGVCTLVVTQGSTVKSISAKAESNVSDTQCFPLNLSLVGLSPGDATFKVSYNSDAYTGVSATTQITIP